MSKYIIMSQIGSELKTVWPRLWAEAGALQGAEKENGFSCQNA